MPRNNRQGRPVLGPVDGGRPHHDHAQPARMGQHQLLARGLARGIGRELGQAGGQRGDQEEQAAGSGVAGCEPRGASRIDRVECSASSPRDRAGDVDDGLAARDEARPGSRFQVADAQLDARAARAGSSRRAAPGPIARRPPAHRQMPADEAGGTGERRPSGAMVWTSGGPTGSAGDGEPLELGASALDGLRGDVADGAAQIVGLDRGAAELARGGEGQASGAAPARPRTRRRPPSARRRPRPQRSCSWAAAVVGPALHDGHDALAVVVAVDGERGDVARRARRRDARPPTRGPAARCCGRRR